MCATDYISHALGHGVKLLLRPNLYPRAAVEDLRAGERRERVRLRELHVLMGGPRPAGPVPGLGW